MSSINSVPCSSSAGRSRCTVERETWRNCAIWLGRIVSGCSGMISSYLSKRPWLGLRPIVHLPENGFDSILTERCCRYGNKIGGGKNFQVSPSSWTKLPASVLTAGGPHRLVTASDLVTSAEASFLLVYSLSLSWANFCEMIWREGF